MGINILNGEEALDALRGNKVRTADIRRIIKETDIGDDELKKAFTITIEAKLLRDNEFVESVDLGMFLGYLSGGWLPEKISAVMPIFEKFDDQRHLPIVRGTE